MVGITHQSTHDKDRTKIPKKFRLTLRFICAAIIVLLGLTNNNLRPVALVALVAAIVTFLAVVEMCVCLFHLFLWV